MTDPEPDHRRTDRRRAVVEIEIVFACVGVYF